MFGFFTATLARPGIQGSMPMDKRKNQSAKRVCATTLMLYCKNLFHVAISNAVHAIVEL